MFNSFVLTRDKSAFLVQNCMFHQEGLAAFISGIFEVQGSLTFMYAESILEFLGHNLHVVEPVRECR